MKVFAFDPGEYQEAYRQDGWVHVKDGADPAFLAIAREIIARGGVADRLASKGISGEKDQYLFEFPPDVDYETDIFDVIAALSGIRRDTITLSERHVKAYSEDADPSPPAHKDRLSSQVSVGISIDVPQGSHLVLYPAEHRETNPFLTTGLRDSLEPDAVPELILKDAVGVEVHDAPGDVIIFPGASTWHLRRLSAGTVNIYLKFNDFGADPLGEDPWTARRRAATQAALSAPSGQVTELVPVFSRRFDSIVREYSRVGWREMVSASVWGQASVPLSAVDATVLQLLGSGRTCAEVVDAVGGDSRLDVGHALRRLAMRGVVDLLPARPPSAPGPSGRSPAESPPR